MMTILTTDNADLPDHLIASILFAADLDVDARRALRMKPGRVERLISAEARSTLSLLFKERSRYMSDRRDAVERCLDILMSCHGPSITRLGPRKTMTMYMTVRTIDVRTVMHFEKLLVIDEEWFRQKGGLPYIRGSVHCDVQTGEVFPQYIDYDNEEFDD